MIASSNSIEKLNDLLASENMVRVMIQFQYSIVQPTIYGRIKYPKHRKKLRQKLDFLHNHRKK